MTMTICLAPSLGVSMKYIYGNKMENQGIVLPISTAQSGRKQNTSMTTFWKRNVQPPSTAQGWQANAQHRKTVLCCFSSIHLTPSITGEQLAQSLKRIKSSWSLLEVNRKQPQSWGSDWESSQHNARRPHIKTATLLSADTYNKPVQTRVTMHFPLGYDKLCDNLLLVCMCHFLNESQIWAMRIEEIQNKSFCKMTFFKRIHVFNDLWVLLFKGRLGEDLLFPNLFVQCYSGIQTLTQFLNLMQY